MASVRLSPVLCLTQIETAGPWVFGFARAEYHGGRAGGVRPNEVHSGQKAGQGRAMQCMHWRAVCNGVAHESYGREAR